MPASAPLPTSGKTIETNGKKPQIWVISDGTAGMRLQAIALGEALIAADITNQTSLADINSDALGYSVQVFAFVGLTSQAETDLQDFETLVSTWPQVRECHMLMGETDFLLKIVAHDWDDFQKFLTSRLTPAKNVSHVKTALSIRSAKKLVGVPVNQA